MSEKKRNNKFRNQVETRSKRWGKDKFKPKPFVRTTPAPVPETAKPWQHVKNDILDDEEELRSSNRCNMDSQQAKDVLKQREKNHRRNIIEANRNEKTTWEKFDDDGDNSASGSSASKVKTIIKTKNQEHLKPWERNFVRKKLTKIANQKYNDSSMNDMIRIMRRNARFADPQTFKKLVDQKK
ncbi:hypothetical protein ACLKA6_002455 [Drosophila palustris]